jgi:hypothetical protein
MRPTQHHQIVEICFTAIDPVNNMMHFAPTRRPVTLRMGTPTIAHRDRPPLRQRRAPLLPAHIQRLTSGTEHDRGDLRVAAQPAHLTRPDPPAKIEMGTAQPGLERVQPHDDRHVRALPTLGRQATLVQGVRADLSERVGLALAQRLVLIRGRFDQCRDRPGHRLERRRVQLALDPPTHPVPGLAQVQLVDLRIILTRRRTILIQHLQVIVGMTGQLPRVDLPSPVSEQDLRRRPLLHRDPPSGISGEHRLDHLGMRQIDLQRPQRHRRRRQFRLQHLTQQRPSREHTQRDRDHPPRVPPAHTQQITHRIRRAHPTIDELAVLIQPRDQLQRVKITLPPHHSTSLQPLNPNLSITERSSARNAAMESMTARNATTEPSDIRQSSQQGPTVPNGIPPPPEKDS